MGPGHRENFAAVTGLIVSAGKSGITAPMVSNASGISTTTVENNLLKAIRADLAVRSMWKKPGGRWMWRYYTPEHAPAVLVTRDEKPKKRAPKPRSRVQVRIQIAPNKKKIRLSHKERAVAKPAADAKRAAYEAECQARSGFAPGHFSSPIYSGGTWPPFFQPRIEVHNGRIVPEHGRREGMGQPLNIAEIERRAQGLIGWAGNTMDMPGTQYYDRPGFMGAPT